MNQNTGLSGRAASAASLSGFPELGSEGGDLAPAVTAMPALSVTDFQVPFLFGPPDRFRVHAAEDGRSLPGRDKVVRPRRGCRIAGCDSPLARCGIPGPPGLLCAFKSFLHGTGELADRDFPFPVDFLPFIFAAVQPPVNSDLADTQHSRELRDRHRVFFHGATDHVTAGRTGRLDPSALTLYILFFRCHSRKREVPRP